MINEHFKDGEIVTLKTLREKGCAPRRAPGGLKILAGGELKKKVSIEAHAFSAAAQKALEERSISFKLIDSLHEAG
jgi:large subunit ribosomal protein L15